MVGSDPGAAADLGETCWKLSSRAGASHFRLAPGLGSVHTGPAEGGLMARWLVMVGCTGRVSHEDGGRSWLGKAKRKGKAPSEQRLNVTTKTLTHWGLGF